MDSPRGTLLGDMWRATPLGWRIAGGLVLLGFAAWGISGWVEGIRKGRLRAEIQAYLAALPPVPAAPAVAPEDDGAPLLLEAMAAVDRKPMGPDFYSLPAESWTEVPPQVAGALEANAEALKLLEQAAGKESFAHSGSTLEDPKQSLWALWQLVSRRAQVELHRGQVSDSVRSALLGPRMARRIGPDRGPPFSAGLSLLTTMENALARAVVDPRLDEASAEAILRHLPTGAEARAFARAEFDAWNVRFAGERFVELLGEDGEARARARGWRPPTLHEKLMMKLGKHRPQVPLEDFPTAARFRELWEDAVTAREILGLEGPALRERLAPIPAPEPFNDVYVRDGLPRFAQAIRANVVREAELEVLRAAAAARLFEMRKGRAPENLAELVPEFLPRPARDPFTGGAPRFEPVPGGWEIGNAGPGAAGSDPAVWCGGMPTLRWVHPASAPPVEKR